MSDDGPALRLRGVTYAYATHLGLRKHPVLLGVDLELARGRALGLAGPNGSGKSTLLRLLAGLERPSGGELLVLGKSPAERAVRKRIGYLPEDSPFPPELSGRATLDLLGALQGMSRASRRSEGERLLAKVGLADRARTPLARYSRGMLRRFGLAQAWLSSPELLLLDEPTAGLDAQGFEVLQDLLGEARARGSSVVLASHVVSDLSERCDDLAVLLDGRVASSGSPREVLGGRSLLDLSRRRDGAAP